MTGLTVSERGLIRRALYLAGGRRCTEAALSDAQHCLTDMVRLAEVLDGRITHLTRQLAESHRPAGMTAAERAHVCSLHRELERAEFRLELASAGPVRYTLTPAAVALFDGGEVKANA